MRRASHLLAIVGITAASLTGATAASAASTCHGLPTTTAEHGGTITGTERRDVILLTRAGTIDARGGDDVICGSRFADVIDGGPGRDVVIAGRGDDVIHGGSGRDHLFGEGGADTLHGGRHRDLIVGGAGADRLPRQNPDLIAPGQFGISVLLPPETVEDLRAADLAIGVTRTTTSPIPLAQAVVPFPQTTMGLGDYLAFASPTVPDAGAVLAAVYEQEAAFGSIWGIGGSGPPVLMPETGPANAISILNRNFEPKTGGIAQAISAWSGEKAAPILASTIPGDSTQAFVPSSTVAIFPTSDRVGTILGALPTGSAVSSVTPAQPTATFTWDATTGTFVAG